MKVEFDNKTGDGATFHFDEDEGVTVELQGQYDLLGKYNAIELANAILSYYGENK